MKLINPIHKWRVLQVLSLVGALAAGSQVAAQTRYSYSSDGSEVTDTQTKLTWRRCSEGQTWSGTVCSGAATSLTHEQALVQAQTQTGWRLPNVKELASLVASTQGPAIDLAVFPGTTGVNYWSASPDVRLPSYAWVVDFGTGSVLSIRRPTAGVLVRLVR
ncbi:DUF1566 domain-containing protein [Rhodoferax sp.]|uniref:Lcl C-terminal domain-containing protein n=1 Tax=Rhodoferax sp. TaxID=50421 RepID=UPI002612F6B1|nr:DUF1566 domain-containing protein [Rhodoferax sp.]MDD2926285.1 DUF1566 domain-containing protein [Rhodoferax sp.]